MSAHAVGQRSSSKRDGTLAAQRVASRHGLTAEFYRFVAHTDPVNDWQETYDEVAIGSLGDTTAGLLYRSPLEQRVATFRRLCGRVAPGARILDVGCANGMFWEALLERRPTVGVRLLP